MSAPHFVSFDIDADVCVITIDRPDRRNAVDREVANELREAFERFEADDMIRIAVLTGAGGHFCAGGDLTARWTFQDGQVVDTQDKTIPAGAQVTDFSISKPDGWPAGKYKLEVMNNGMVVQTREFDIK